jgi:phage shock protein PspC (stress-responsive transcriptional regulator)
MENAESIREARRLTRPREGRWLGGVCAGLGRYFDLSPAVYRIAFVALALAGGTGILLYLAAWLIIPEEGAEDSIAATALRGERDRPALAIGLAVLAFAAILALGEATLWPSPGNIWFAVAIAGAALVWWRASGRSKPPPALQADAVEGTETTAAVEPARPRRRRLVGGVLVIGFLGLLVALVLSLAVRVPLFAGIGDRSVHPTTVAALHHKYELGVGNFDVDLGAVRFPLGETHVKAALGMGDLIVRIPKGVAVDVDGHASAGQVVLFGQIDDGTWVDSHVRESGTRPNRVLVLDARVGLGRVTVARG